MKDQIKIILKKAENLAQISFEEALFLSQNAETDELARTAHAIRLKIHPDNWITWIIDRNINITNICHSACQFCNFYCAERSNKAYITNLDTYKEKINYLFKLGGNQLLLQGGMHPKLGLKFYTELFSSLKKEFPTLKLHALGPPEIHHISQLEKCSYQDTLSALRAAGLDSLPGAGAEILCDRVRNKISPRKCSSQEWLDVMKVAHQMGFVTSATMMYGHIETMEERLQHLFKIREVQNQKPVDSKGFISFIPWPFYANNTQLEKKYQISTHTDSDEYIRLIAISRIILVNFENIQASWLTVGPETAKKTLHAGANDLGSIMIEENVVSKAGANYRFSSEEMQTFIKECGFIPKRRNQEFKLID